MSDYQLLGQGVYHLDSHYIRPGLASLYAIVNNGEVAFIETGTALSLPYVMQFLEQTGLTVEQVRYVIPTHVHLDHAGGAGVMMQAFPHAELVIHPRGARHMIDPSRLVAGARQVYGEKVFDELYGEIPPVAENRVIVADHETRIMLNDRELLIVDTPGHAYHHFCVVDEFSRGIFSGDTFGLSYPDILYKNKRFVIPTTTPIHFNPQALLSSIDLLMSFQPERMYLTHFNMLADPSSVVDQYRNWVEKFVALTETVKPVDETFIPQMITRMGDMLSTEFEVNPRLLETDLAMDIKLNCQGLAHWYQHRKD